MIEDIKAKIGNQKIKGIIPVNPKDLKVKFANTSYTTGFVHWFVYFIIALIPTPIFMFIISDLLMDPYVHLSKILALFILIIGGIMFLADYIYKNSIKTYPETLLVITDSDMYFFAVKNGRFEIAHTFDLNVNKLGEFFYGEINRKTKRIGKNFEIRKEGKKLLSGKLLVSDNRLYSPNVPDELLLPVEKLQKIYLS